MEIEKRKNPRVDFGITVLLGGKCGKTKDISSTGTFIKKDEWDQNMKLSPISSEVDLSFVFPTSKEYIDVKGIVVHHGKNNEGVGIWFKKIEERNKEFIKQFIAKYLWAIRD